MAVNKYLLNNTRMYLFVQTQKNLDKFQTKNVNF